MSLYGQYIKERLGKEILECADKGFATYSFKDNSCYIEDIYVCPDNRHEHIASHMTNSIAEIAKNKGCTSLLGSIVPSANYSTDSLKALLAYGFELDSCINNFIVLKKDI